MSDDVRFRGVSEKFTLRFERMLNRELDSGERGPPAAPWASLMHSAQLQKHTGEDGTRSLRGFRTHRLSELNAGGSYCALSRDPRSSVTAALRRTWRAVAELRRRAQGQRVDRGCHAGMGLSVRRMVGSTFVSAQSALSFSMRVRADSRAALSALMSDSAQSRFLPSSLTRARLACEQTHTPFSRASERAQGRRHRTKRRLLCLTCRSISCCRRCSRRFALSCALPGSGIGGAPGCPRGGAVSMSDRGFTSLSSNCPLSQVAQFPISQQTYRVVQIGDMSGCIAKHPA